MCLYIPEFVEEDENYLRRKSLPTQKQGANVAAIYVLMEDGQEFESGKCDSGVDGPHRRSAYGKKAWQGHKNDAEIRALFALPALPTNVRGTVYFVGTGGVCDSCKGP
jgi:hypothetical protein